MGGILRIAVSLLILSLFLSVLTVSVSSAASDKADFRGLWVATVVNIDYPSKPATDPEILKSEALKILDYAYDTGFNAVFLQVRPTADALYKSKYFPWSKYLTGRQGLMPDNGFDTLGFWVTEAHKRGIELHAWINPYRITKKSSAEPSYDFSSLAPDSPAVLNPGWVVKYSDGNLYFDPGIPEVRKLIIDGVLEIIDNYEIDGIHFDDYFYPGKDFKDKATYGKYGAAFGNIDDWRRANVNTLIRDLSNAIKASGKNVRFGISPFGIWANKKTNSSGSDTQGMQSYYDYYADTRKWVKDGLIDYIAPQLYWNIGYSVADYSKLLSWWRDTVKGTGVDLYIGQAAYRSGNPDPSSPWYGVAEIERQLQLNDKVPEVKGSIFYNYKSLADSPALSKAIKTIYRRKDGAVEIPKLSAFPQVREYRMPGEEITLSCQAPKGAKVTVRLDNKSYEMKPSTAYAREASFITYTYVYTMPSYISDPRNFNVGVPVYTMSYRGIGKTCTAPAGIGVITKNSPFYAKVTKEVIAACQTPYSENGTAFGLYKKMLDYVLGMKDGYTHSAPG